MRTMSLHAHLPARDWHLVTAAGFVALTVFAAAIDRRNAFIDRSVANPPSAERVAAPLTPSELAREMMTHD
ncbi:hypothetical protein [Methylobacterium haplocladii]|uniref:Uncharacterized protein n=1 Tax=Methylobacterium haplocladii TaxID=1176176 RepID=A0A512IN11_9HYPH|nr:hypothetical protein [Methylobacterium haplocladii]GEO99081.1 hypothetical protein MHA02_14690 [Methylobacterium haplocladii]GJD84073.1 hypothetical protein HPGCJGGD_1948 [Methylobacterium haplocladii]GLS60064.1 hypothetical protein GCM10007887_27410 [Methylobacterium haplocladii]